MAPTESACLRDWRRTLFRPLVGDVLEVGAGTGVNLEHYGPDVRRLVLSEPEPSMRARLTVRVARDARVEVSNSDAAHLRFDAASFDIVVSTLVLCSVPDPMAALADIHRVLRPGGQLVFIEHVAAEEGTSRLRWQYRVEPVWKWFADGCRLTRRTDRLIEQAGFSLENVTRQSMRKALPIVRPSVRGVARK